MAIRAYVYHDGDWHLEEVSVKIYHNGAWQDASLYKRVGSDWIPMEDSYEDSVQLRERIERYGS